MMRSLGKWIIFLMILAGVSRFLMTKRSVPVVDSASAFVGGLFQSTING